MIEICEFPKCFTRVSDFRVHRQIFHVSEFITLVALRILAMCPFPVFELAQLI